MSNKYLSNGSVYNAYYGDFRGVDFSSDHTQVHKQRLAYAVNMFKDYQSGQGQALETIAGFRRRLELPESPVVYGIHRFQHRSKGGDILTKILVHAGEDLYLWHNYPNSINVAMKETVILPEESSVINGTRTFKVRLSDNVAGVRNITKSDGESILLNMDYYNPDTHELSISRSDLVAGDNLYLSYVEGEISKDDTLFDGMNARRSASFIFNNRLYLIDGKNYLVYDGETVKKVEDVAYIPTTYINIIPSGENADIGTEYEQRNILQPKFKHTFIADGTTKEFYMNENALEEVSEVKVYGKVVNNYEVNLPNGKITFSEAPPRPEEVDGGAYPEFYAGIEITAKKTFTSVSGVTEECEEIGTLITNCTIATVFDNRIFMSGNPNYPNHVFYCGRNITGYVDPTFFGILNYMQDGVGISPITGMIPVADTLMVLKSDAQQDGSTYFHTAVETGENLQPKLYPSTQGLSGIGCLGSCINFLDDPVFVSRLGVEAVGQLSVRYERAVEHRSSLIDAKLVNIDLRGAALEEWNGYLILLVDGKIFMADSRQKYTHEIGVPQYEWYYIEGVGVYKDQYPEYRYASQIYQELDGAKVRYCTACHKSATECTCGNNDHIVELPLTLAESAYNADLGETHNLLGEIVNAPDEDGKSTAEIFSDVVSFQSDGIVYSVMVYFTIHEVYDGVTGDFVKYEAFLCEAKGNKTGGVFQKATIPKTMDGNLFFGTENGVVCSFNFDMRDEQGEIAPRYYTFDERTIFCGCATKMDCCDIPHLTKNTVKKSTVIKTKSIQTSVAKIKVRTNKKPYEQIARINSTMFSFDNMDFSDFSFISAEQSLFSIKEKEKKWVEKQYFLYSDEYMKPFALYYLSFRYTIAGRYKE
jgi:hypothetical protein